MTTVIQAYRFALDPTPEQDAALRSHCGGQRFAFNWGLNLVKANLDQRAAEKSYGVPDAELTPSLSWSAYSLRKTWNGVKDDLAPWWSQNSKEAYSSGLANLATALGNWNDSRTGQRQGPTVRFPRFKGKRAGLSCRFSTGAFGLADTDRRHVRLPRIGTVRTGESTRKLARHVERGAARIRSATVAFRAGRWHCAFSVEVERRDLAPAKPGTVVGVDLGIANLAVLSTPVPGVTDEHGFVPNPRLLDVALGKLRRLQRQAARRTGPDRRTGRRPSRRWVRTQARLARLHTAVANARRDGLHKLTTGLAGAVGVIVVEDLHVAGMLRNRRLARHIAGVGWGELRRQLDYKTSWRGGRLQVADRWFASSKTCSDCGYVKAKLPLGVRVFTCDECGLALDRDLNAARNLAQLVDEIAGGTSSSSCGARVNEPAGNLGKTTRKGATGTATGRPTRTPGGPTPHRKVPAA